MNAVIIICSSLDKHVDAAQKKMNTDYPVISVDRKYHDDPKKMKEKLLEKIEELPPEVDTILMALGFCGGSLEAMPLTKRMVVPRVDDCITMLLHTDDNWHSNLKKPGHMYLRDRDTGAYSVEGMKKKWYEEYGEEDGEFIFETMFSNYTNADIIDTGVYDCHSEEYLTEAQRNADLIGCPLSYVQGSNILMEKLVFGQWDQQFIVVEPGQVLSNQDFL